MHLHKILTEDYLRENLIENKISIAQLAINSNCCKHMIIKYCKKLNIYDDVKRMSSISNKTSRDLTNEKFGKILALEISSNDAFGKKRWLCQCECGRKKIINASSLIKGLTKTCGYCADRHSFKGYKDISGSYWRRVIENSEKRSLNFNITPEYVWNIYIEQERRCALSGVHILFHKNQDKGSLQSASIDRISSKLGYVENNIQVLHKRVQKLKDVVPNDEFIYWCKLIHENKEEYSKTLVYDVSKIGYNDK